MKTLLILVLVIPFVSLTNAEATQPATTPIDQLLNTFHQSAATANGEVYFSLFHRNGVFIGTDAGERWTVNQFQEYAQPYFSQGKGWTYTPSTRHIDISEDGQFAWFDELLWNEKYGQCRGSGALIKTPTGWKILQYHLTFPIPNTLAKELTEKIKAHITKE
ncbi:nuclear transport factor 2 family protein [Corallincola spongiicola]|uniref:Protein with SnoaL 3 domain, NTF 2 superfamily n=1 Tax=Corallincola spongiicola TaxID=2520508 RepID=A0ABY1WQA2_9GAMM|nr:nuclear transport factor 2 family protein [Corallincola spongiicola]TAA46906.1 protein with SnoaL 3 domain, NTF 2 superfamily [Corallincola spongiicola]